MKIRKALLLCNLRSKCLSFEQLGFGTALLKHAGCASTFVRIWVLATLGKRIAVPSKLILTGKNLGPL